MKSEATHDLDSCGFVCPHGSFRMLLSTLQTRDILEYFRQRTAFRSIQCPECGNKNTYRRSDLK
jgi:DNA-directed RNA polymerase subunit RPC12/RpoP